MTTLSRRVLSLEINNDLVSPVCLKKDDVTVCRSKNISFRGERRRIHNVLMYCKDYARVRINKANYYYVVVRCCRRRPDYYGKVMKVEGKRVVVDKYKQRRLTNNERRRIRRT